MTPLRALVFASTFPLRPDDGMPRFVYDLAQALCEHGEIAVLAPDAPGAAREETLERVAVRRFTYFRPRSRQVLAYGHGIRGNLRASHLAKLQVATFFPAQFFALRRAIRECCVNVVSSHWMIPQGLTAAFARHCGLRFAHVLTILGGDLALLRALPPPLGRALARYIHRRTDATFCVSSEARRQFDALLGYPSGALVQPTGVNVAAFAAGHAEPIESPFPGGFLLFVGRFIPIKGVPVLLDAMSRIRRAVPGLGLVLIGYGPDEEDLRKQTTALGLDDAVQFAGRKPHAEVARYLAGCQALIVPSIIERAANDSGGETEGLPTVILEAMAAGTCVVATQAGGAPDVIRHQESGFLCRPNDAADLAETVLAALRRPDPESVVQRARATVEDYDWPKAAARYAEVFRRLLDAPSAGGARA